MRQIPSDEIERLSKIAALTTSPHDGEALNALRILNKRLSSFGLSWSGVFQSGARATPSPICGREDPSSFDLARWRQPFRECWAWREFLSELDQHFLAGIKERETISGRQGEWLVEIHEKVAALAAERYGARGA